MPVDEPISQHALRPSRRIHEASRLDSSYLAYAKSLAHGNSDPQLRLDVCRQFIRCGMIGETIAMLSTLMDVRHLRASVAELMGEVRELRRRCAEDRALLQGTGAEGDDSEDRGYWVVPADSDTTLIAFTGKARRLGLSIYFMQSLLGRLNANVVYLFDWSDSYYLAGVSGLGETVETTVGRLHSLCSGLRSRRVLCLGQSAGGYGALHYGTRLGADGVIAFSPVILPVMTKKTRDRIGAAIGQPLTEDDTDLRRVIASARRTPYTEIVYGSENAVDAASARHLAGLPNIVERPLPGISNHGTIKEVVVGRTFETMIDAFSMAVGPGAWGEQN